MFEFERLSGGLGNVAEYAIAWSRSRHGGASERYDDLADELPMESAAEPPTAKGHTTSPKMISRHR